MPYLADGSFTPDMPITTSGAPVNALAQPLPATADGTPPPASSVGVPFSKQTGQPRYEADRQAMGFAPPSGDVLKGVPKTAKPAAPGFAQMKAPSFLDYAQYAAKRDSTRDAALDPATMDDATYLKYAKEYADTMLPQALMSAGHKVTPEYLKTLTPNFQYQTAQKLDDIRNHFKSQKPPVDPSATPPAADPTYMDYVKQLGAKATELGSTALAGAVRSLSQPGINPVMGTALTKLISNVSPTAHKFFDKLDEIPDAISKFGSATGKSIASGESAGFQGKEQQPFLHPDQPWITPEGGLNPKKFNANSLNLPNVVGKGEDVMLPLIALAATKNPGVAAAAFGIQSGEASHQAEQERLGALTPDQWKQVPAYVHKIQEGKTDDQAKAEVTDESAKMQQLVGAASGSLTGLAGGLPFFKPAASGFFSRILKNYAVQAPSFAALSGAGTAASNLGKTAVTGEQINPLAGVGEAAVTGAATAAPFAFMGGGHDALKNKPATTEAPGTPDPTQTAGGEPTAQATPVQAAVNYAMESVPPPSKPFSSPAQAQSHYAQALSAFKGELRGQDIPPEQVAGMIPAFDKAWSDATGHDPKTGTPLAPAGAAAQAPVPDDAAAAAAQAPPDGTETPPEQAPAQGGLDLTQAPTIDTSGPPSVAEAAAAREAVAADHLPEGLRTRVASDLKDSLGREPSNSEVAKQAGHLLDIALEQPGIDKNIPRPAIEEALGELMSKDKTFPDVDAINDLARKKAENPNQEKIKYQEGLNLEPNKGSDILKKGFDAIAKRETAERAAALKEKKEATIKAQDIDNDTQRNQREKEVNDAYEKRIKEAGDNAQKERDNAHASAEREREISEHAERQAESAKERDALKRKTQVKKARPVAENDSATGDLALSVKETATGHPKEGWLRQESTPEEQAKLLPAERYFKQFKNVGDMLTSLKDRVKNAPYLKTVIERLLANPYLRDELGKTPFRVHNPGDARTPQTDDIGHYQRYTDEGFESRNTFGSFNLSGKDGVVIAGSRWAPHSDLYNGLNPITAVHESIHAGIARLIAKHETDLKAGRPTNPVMDNAYQQLQEVRQALKGSGELDKIEDKDTKAWLTYATTNVHELISVALSDPKAQAWLKSIPMGKVTAWKKLVGIVSKFLGIHEGSEQNALEHIMEQANKFIDYKPADYKTLNLHSKLDSSPEAGLAQTLFSSRSDRVEENTPERVMDAIAVKPPAQRVAEENQIAREQNKPNAAAARATYIFDKLKPLTQAIQLLAGKGMKVGPRENIDEGARVYQNLAARAANIAQQQFIQPTIQKIVKLAGKSGKSSDEFLTHLSAWYFGKRALEINDRGEMEHARLTKDAEVKRQAIRDDWAQGKIPQGEYLSRLREVVESPGARVENRSPLNHSGINDETAHELISRARKNGITPDVINQFDPYRKNMLAEIDRNYQRSGRFSTFDAARRDALGSKYYVPLKGFGEAGDEMGSAGLGAFTREYTGAQGRTTIARNPLLNLMQELQGSARDVPENGLTRIVYDFAKKYGKEFGATIRTMDVEAAVKDAIASGGSIGDMDKSFKNPQTVIHNNGEYRYSIEFPEGSPILEALKSINESRELNTFERMAGSVTNLISRGATTLNPKFLLWNAFWRDTGYVGTQIGMDLGPQATAEYAARYWMQGGPLRGRATYFKNLVQPRNALERDAYAATGKSKFAQSLSEIAKYGGDLSFENELNTVRNMDTAYEALRKAAGEDLSPVEKLAKLTHPLISFLDQIGTSDIMTARVAAYETYQNVATRRLGHAPSDAEAVQIKKNAALYSRRVLDYQQRSDLSRSLNVVFPFARVVMTQTDRLLQTFKNADGSYDKKKIALTTAVGLMAGATYYSLLRQASPDVRKQENSTLAQNFVVPVDGKLIRIPMAYGLTRLFLVPGMMAARAMYGDSSNEDATNEIRNALFEGLTPLKPPEAQHNEKFHDEVMDMVTSMTPGAMRPFLEIERNKNVFGSAITPSDDRTKGPHSQGGFNGTPDAWKWMAKTLHDVTGGSIDVYPESLEYLTGAYGTGPGNAFMRAASIQSKGSGTDTDIQKLPFVPAITSRDAEFYERREIEHLKEDLQDKGKPLPKDESKKEAGVSYLSEKDTALLKEINSSQQKFGKQRAAIYKNEILGKAQKQKLLDQVTAQQKGEQAALLRRVGHGS